MACGFVYPSMLLGTQLGAQQGWRLQQGDKNRVQQKGPHNGIACQVQSYAALMQTLVPCCGAHCWEWPTNLPKPWLLSRWHCMMVSWLWWHPRQDCSSVRECSHVLVRTTTLCGTVAQCKIAALYKTCTLCSTIALCRSATLCSTAALCRVVSATAARTGC